MILETRGLTKRFGAFTALNGVSVGFRADALTSVIGPNGAGKSTFFNLVSGAFPPSAGQVLFEGRDITGTPQHRFAGLGIAKSFQITNVFPALTALENVRVAARHWWRGLIHGGRGHVSPRLRSRRRRCWRPSACSTAPVPPPRPWRMGSSGRWRSRWRSHPARACCCWMNRRPA